MFNIVLHCCVCVRFVDAVIQFLLGEAAGVQTLKQFSSLKIDDIAWTANTLGGQKVFVRMAIKKLKAETGSTVNTRW